MLFGAWADYRTPQPCDAVAARRSFPFGQIAQSFRTNFIRERFVRSDGRGAFGALSGTVAVICIQNASKQCGLELREIGSVSESGELADGAANREIVDGAGRFGD